MSEQVIDIGDVVRHEKSGEEWIVAAIIDGWLYPAGWPPGSVQVDECVLVEKAPDGEREEMLRRMAKIQGSDPRCIHARKLLAEPMMRPDEVPPISASPMWEWFELTYAAYLVLPRVALVSMPLEWQLRQKALLEEMEKRLGKVPAGDGHMYHVTLRDAAGRFVADPLADYRHHPPLNPRGERR